MNNVCRHSTLFDIKGPLPRTVSEVAHEEGYRYILTVVDHFSRWTRFIPLRADKKGELNSARIAQALVQHWFCQFGVPDLLVSDRGPQFRAALINVRHLKAAGNQATPHPCRNTIQEREG